KEMLKAALRAQRPVVWDATNLRIDFRKRLAQLGFDYHALVTLVLFHTPETSLFARNRLRAHPIPEAALARHLEILEWPTPDEAHRIWHIGEDGEMLG
ncbi:MAG: AAA family ATPase, partial [Calditrichaeota bacterium]|nr:AAA family ATPase [Calditrichota bacterium]